MATKPSSKPDEQPNHFWQPPEKRSGISEQGRKWLEENAEAIKSWGEWAEQNELPLSKHRQF